LNSPVPPTIPTQMLIPATIVLLWLQLYWSLIPTWRDGEYYGYGWFVPPLALAFAWRRWQMDREAAGAVTGEGSVPGGGADRWLGAGLVLGMLLIIPLRTIAEVDPSWRPPLLLHTALVVAITHALVWRVRGPALSLALLPVTVFALSAVPPPWQIEQALVRRLTATVVTLTKETFLWTGRPVEVIGERFYYGGEVVEVAEGCSGIRSLQSLIMAGLFFGELLLLGMFRRVLLLGVAAACAIVINTSRAWALAEIQFSKGAAAAEAAHDGLGHIAFVASAAILFAAAWLLQRRKTGRVVVRRQTGGGV